MNTETGYRTFAVRNEDGEASPRGILTTEAPIPMMDWKRGEYVPEVLLMSGMKARGRAIKLLDTHKTDSVSSVLGGFTDIRVRPAGERDVPDAFADGNIQVSEVHPEVATKIREGFINEMSVGYRYSDEKTTFVPEGETVEVEGKAYTGPVNIRTEWDAQEASLVPLGADSQAQIRGFQNFAEAQQKISRRLDDNPTDSPGLNADGVKAHDKAEGKDEGEKAEKTQINQQPKSNNIMEDSISNDGVEEQVREAVKVQKNEFDKRADAILALGEEVGDSNWAISHLRSGASVEDVQRDAISKLKEATSNLGVKTEGDVGLSKKEQKTYSISKAMLELAEGRKVGGLEGEVSGAISDRCNRHADGFFVAPEAFRSEGTRAATLAGTIASAGTGGGVVQDDLLAGSFIDALRPTMASAQAGITILNGLTGNVIIPKKTTAAAATWAGDEATSAHAEGPVVIGSISLEPQHLGCYTEVSKQLLHQGTPDVDMLIRDDLAASVAQGLDQAVFRGSGSGQPQGVQGGTSVETSAVATPGSPLIAELFEFVSDVEDGNALNGSLAWVTTPTVASYLKQTQLYSNTDSTMWDWRNGNTILGYPAISTSNADTHDIQFGNWADYLLCLFDGIDLVAIQDATGAKKRLITYVVNLMADGDVRRGQSFCTNA